MAFTYRCADFPGMESCPGSFTADTKEEVLKHVELHATEAHQEDPAKWSAEDRQGVQIIR
jgi:predicted small metal-binding protein